MEPGESTSSTQPTADSLKEQGNACVRKKDYAGALLLYTDAIKLNSKDPVLYSNRSLAFLKLHQYYYADQDADTVIQLNPTWAKGHFRKGEVLSAVGHYDSALLSYGRAIQLQPGDRDLIFAANKAATCSSQQAEYEKRLPWVGAGIGIIIGVIIGLSDKFLTKEPTLKHPVLMLLIVFAIAGIGFIVAKCMRYYTRLNKKSLLEPPPDLLEEFQQESNEDDADYENHSNRQRYTKAQARMRFRKGKL